MAISYVRAESQHSALEKIAGQLTEEEAEMARRGRNANKVTSSKNADPADYRAATGLETLFGYLYITGRNDRIRELFSLIISD
jgi:ribonuclease-3 family protein